MESSPQPPQRRKRNPYTHLACTSCKAKHVRCDGGRPACGLCVRKNRQCVYRDERNRRKMSLGDGEVQSVDSNKYKGMAEKWKRKYYHLKSLVAGGDMLRRVADLSSSDDEEDSSVSTFATSDEMAHVAPVSNARLDSRRWTWAGGSATDFFQSQGMVHNPYPSTPAPDSSIPEVRPASTQNHQQFLNIKADFAQRATRSHPARLDLPFPGASSGIPYHDRYWQYSTLATGPQHLAPLSQNVPSGNMSFTDPFYRMDSNNSLFGNTMNQIPPSRTANLAGAATQAAATTSPVHVITTSSGRTILKRKPSRSLEHSRQRSWSLDEAAAFDAARLRETLPPLSLSPKESTPELGNTMPSNSFLSVPTLSRRGERRKDMVLPEEDSDLPDVMPSAHAAIDGSAGLNLNFPVLEDHGYHEVDQMHIDGEATDLNIWDDSQPSMHAS